MIDGRDISVIAEAIDAVERVAGREEAYDFGMTLLKDVEQRRRGWFYRFIRRITGRTV